MISGLYSLQNTKLTLILLTAVNSLSLPLYLFEFLNLFPSSLLIQSFNFFLYLHSSSVSARYETYSLNVIDCQNGCRREGTYFVERLSIHAKCCAVSAVLERAPKRLGKMLSFQKAELGKLKINKSVISQAQFFADNRQ